MQLVLVIVEKAPPRENKTYILNKKHNLIGKKLNSNMLIKRINIKHKISLNETMHCCLKNHLFSLL